MLSEVEKVLWHGTLERLADIIANSKFDRGYAGARRKDGECLHSPFTDINQQISPHFLNTIINKTCLTDTSRKI